MKVTARARRVGAWWSVEVVDVPGAYTQTKRLEQVPHAAALAAADLLDIAVSDIEVEVAPELADDVRVLVDAARRASSEAAESQRRASEAMAAAVARLREQESLTTRDAATLLGVSHQRIAQIAGR